ncbi:NAD(P)-binding protein [Pseudomonas sp.]|uniref:NAD(P)-binding protein n=1 Tax=Pseudomonas sp. TaxID=306 RepID=UPI00326624F2
MSDFDAVIIYAGAVGICAAARLVAAGERILLVDGRDRVTGRSGSENIEGFRVNTGAIAIGRGSLLEETFNAVGVPLDVREPNPATVFRSDDQIINISKSGGWGMLLGTFTKQADCASIRKSLPLERSVI